MKGESIKTLCKPILQTLNTTDISDKEQQSKCKMITLHLLQTSLRQFWGFLFLFSNIERDMDCIGYLTNFYPVTLKKPK